MPDVSTDELGIVIDTVGTVEVSERRRVSVRRGLDFTSAVRFIFRCFNRKG